MKRFRYSCGVALLFLVPHVQATLIDNGDTTVDDVTGLEWLDLTLTIGQSYDSIVAGFGGYAAQGYVHADLGQLCGLFGALGDPTPSCTGAADIVTIPILAGNANLFNSLWGTTWDRGGGNLASWGIFDSGLLGNGKVGIGCIDTGWLGCISNPGSPTVERKLDWITVAQADIHTGHWLVRSSSVPESTTLALLVLGLAGVGLRNRGRPNVS